MLPAADAEDAWSETFLAALRAYPDLDPNANVQAWLITIARRKVIDHGRSRARAPVPAERLPDRHARVEVEFEDADELWTAVRELPDKQREAIAYHHLIGLPYAEVADVLGGTEDSARRAAADGIRNLRRRLVPTTRTEGTIR